MHDLLLPLFPLDVVLLPGTPMPLHIFEDRYKEMIGEAIKNHTEFGVVLSGERGVLNVGCTATVEQVVTQYPDGRLDIVIAGRRRFEVILLDQEKSYLRASVSFFDDEDIEAAPVEVRALAIAGLHALSQADEKENVVMPDHRDPQLSFKIAYFIPELPFRQMMLTLRSETERLRKINEFLPEYIAKLRRINHVRKVAPRNGHGFIHAGEDRAG